MIPVLSTPFLPKHLRFPLTLWSAWWGALASLRPACARSATFLWLAAVLAALCIRPDLAGVTSLLRALGLRRCCYYSLLHCFHSDALIRGQFIRLGPGRFLVPGPELFRGLPAGGLGRQARWADRPEGQQEQ